MSRFVHVDAEITTEWSEQAVIERWERLFTLPILVQRYRAMESLSKAERDAISELTTKWRKCLHDISWFMRCLNEPIARQANQEDGCTGRYWEGRYKSQALLDEKALAACMAYVDLNPVRAGMAKTPEQSEYTAIAERTNKLKQSRNRAKKTNTQVGLLSFAGNLRKNMPKGLPFRLKGYLELVDWTGRAILEHKRGHIPDNQPPILERLQVDPQHWLYMTQHFESRFKGIGGASYKLKEACQRMGYQRTPNLSAALQYFS